ncbi:MAG: MBL fold metallo-hydrolase, partial [Myxococcota bacterium]
MRLTFLGTSAGTPTRDRNVSGVGLSLEREWFLFDCGEGTQHRILTTSLSLSRLRRIFISHLHGDHCFGLFGLLGSRSLAGVATPLDLYGPEGLEEMVRRTLQLSGGGLNDAIRFHTIDEAGGAVHEDETLKIRAVPADHRGVCFSWWLREARRPGPLNVDRALELGVPSGPLLGRLKAGESITLENGQV